MLHTKYIALVLAVWDKTTFKKVLLLILQKNADTEGVAHFDSKDTIESILIEVYQTMLHT